MSRVNLAEMGRKGQQWLAVNSVYILKLFMAGANT